VTTCTMQQNLEHTNMTRTQHSSELQHRSTFDASQQASTIDYHIFWSRLAGFIPSQQRLLCSFAGFLCP
jgi:hypothetical protein